VNPTVLATPFIGMRLTIEPLDVDAHIGLLHEWVTHPRSAFWGMLGATVAEVAAEYSRIAGDPGHHAHLGRADGVPQFLVETYDPHHSELRGLPQLADGDLGMHLLVAPVEVRRTGFTREVFRAVMAFCFDDSVRRVVVEPDVRNEKIARLNAAAGFVVAHHVALPTKTAALSFCTREAFAASQLGGVS
jgi:hypothetical protein